MENANEVELIVYPIVRKFVKERISTSTENEPVGFSDLKSDVEKLFLESIDNTTIRTEALNSSDKLIQSAISDLQSEAQQTQS